MKYSINLLTKRKDDQTLNKAVYFASHYLRYILVITQLIIILVFFYRLKIDQRVVELNEEVKQKEEMIAVSKPLLDYASLISKKTQLIKGILAKENSFVNAVEYVTSSVPDGIKFSKLSYSEGSVTISGVADNVAVLQGFYNKFLTDKKFKFVRLFNIKKGESGIMFDLNLKSLNMK